MLPESSRKGFFEKVSASNFILPDALDNSFGTLKRRRIDRSKNASGWVLLNRRFTFVENTICNLRREVNLQSGA